LWLLVSFFETPIFFLWICVPAGASFFIKNVFFWVCFVNNAFLFFESTQMSCLLTSFWAVAAKLLVRHSEEKILSFSFQPSCLALSLLFDRFLSSLPAFLQKLKLFFLFKRKNVYAPLFFSQILAPAHLGSGVVCGWPATAGSALV
jgi:hypothetical protein